MPSMKMQCLWKAHRRHLSATCDGQFRTTQARSNQYTYKSGRWLTDATVLTSSRLERKHGQNCCAAAANTYHANYIRDATTSKRNHHRQVLVENEGSSLPQLLAASNGSLVVVDIGLQALQTSHGHHCRLPVALRVETMLMKHLHALVRPTRILEVDESVLTTPKIAIRGHIEEVELSFETQAVELVYQLSLTTTAGQVADHDRGHRCGLTIALARYRGLRGLRPTRSARKCKSWPTNAVVVLGPVAW